jgi:hypothetical protein
MISRNGKGNRWFMKQHMQQIPKLVDSTLSRAGKNQFFSEERVMKSQIEKIRWDRTRLEFRFF